MVPPHRIELRISGYKAEVIPFNYRGELAPRPGLEPGTPWLTVKCYYQLSYQGKFGGPKENWTPINGVTSRYTNHYTMRPYWNTLPLFMVGAHGKDSLLDNVFQYELCVGYGFPFSPLLELLPCPSILFYCLCAVRILPIRAWVGFCAILANGFLPPDL